MGLEPWLKPPKNGVLSHGSNPQKRCSRAMAQTPQKMGSRAMAQTPKKGVPEPWLKLNFVLHIFTCKIHYFLLTPSLILNTIYYLTCLDTFQMKNIC